jgi:hypothetical protein
MKINVEQLERGAKIAGATWTASLADPGWWVLSIHDAAVVHDAGRLRAHGTIEDVCDLIALVAACEERMPR